MIRIGIDARMMGASNTRGIGRYIEEMVKAMLPELRENETLVLFERDPQHSPIRHPQVEHAQADIPWYGFSEQVTFPGVIQRANIDSLWVPHWNIPLRYNGPLAVTIHDLLLVNQKKSAKLSTKNPIIFYLKYLAFRIVLHFAMKKADVILPPTEAIKAEIQVFAPRASEKLRVTGEGLGHIKKHPERLFSDRYLLYVGSAYPHKRIDLILEAWEKLNKTHPDLHVLIIGERDIFMKRHETPVREKRLPRVHFLGAVSDEALASYLTHADGFLFPSEYEGFGLPPLEALLCGTPAVATDIPVLKEVLPKTSVFFFHKGEANDMIRAIELMLDDQRTEEEARALAEQIRERHSWRKAAQIALESIRKIQNETSTHGKEEKKTRGASGLEADESQRRTGASA